MNFFWQLHMNGGTTPSVLIEHNIASPDLLSTQAFARARQPFLRPSSPQHAAHTVQRKMKHQIQVQRKDRLFPFTRALPLKI